ncbi:MAG: primosomal protein N' [Prevotella sp.]|nr:primosomal protein N' [Prevotella sp.]
MNYVDLILPVPLEGLFTYSIPERLREGICFGVRVIVPFGPKKTYVGIVTRIHDNPPEGYKIRDIIDIADPRPMLLERQYRLWQWIAEYYLAPIGDVYKAAMPAGMKAEEGFKPKTETYIRLTKQFQNEAALHTAINMLARADKQQQAFLTYLQLSHWDEMEHGAETREITREELMNAAHSNLNIINMLTKRGLMETYEKQVGRLNESGEPHPENIRKLSMPQQDAYNKILMSFMQKNVTLLHGVTSSGKTEIYIHLIQHAIDGGKQVMYLLPEIALTVQIMTRLKRVFGRRLGIYHSKYSDAERVEMWQKQMSKDPYDIIIGARSAVFLPYQRLGLVIIDEEHETSFKQQDPAPRYHARSAAIMLAQMYGAKTLLGTATPSIESYHNAQTGKYGYVALTQRYEGIQLPEFHVVDVKDLQHRKMMTGPFSPMLLAEVRKAIESGKQAILFQNRRGFAPMIECKQCGWVPHCLHCDVSLTLHRTTNQLTCHYCGYTYSIPTKCPCCEGTDLRSRGYGTEKIEDAVREIFPEARVARMDLDTTRTRNAYERIITDFAAGRTNILIGTQMISKGLDFANVSVVGILNADSMLNFPDFRAYEHAFMMMAQVGGRAGRKGQRGLVIMQTKSPDLPIVRQVVDNDYEAMYRSVTEERREYHYPPFYRLVYVYLKHKDDSTVQSAAATMSFKLRMWFGERVLGPDKPPVAKVKALNIRKMIIKLENGIDMKKVRQYLRKAHQDILKDKRFGSLVIYYDMDPM